MRAEMVLLYLVLVFLLHHVFAQEEGLNSASTQNTWTPDNQMMGRRQENIDRQMMEQQMQGNSPRQPMETQRPPINNQEPQLQQPKFQRRDFSVDAKDLSNAGGWDGTQSALRASRGLRNPTLNGMGLQSLVGSLGMRILKNLEVLGVLASIALLEADESCVVGGYGNLGCNSGIHPGTYGTPGGFGGMGGYGIGAGGYGRFGGKSRLGGILGGQISPGGFGNLDAQNGVGNMPYGTLGPGVGGYGMLGGRSRLGGILGGQISPGGFGNVDPQSGAGYIG